MRSTAIVLALVATTAASITAIHHHHQRAGVGPEAAGVLAPVIPLTARASRAHVREPLPPVKNHRGAPLLRVLTRPAQPAGDSALSDVTMYCATGNRNAAGRWPQLGDVAVIDRSIPFGTHVFIDGNVYVVRDWIGSGSQFDIYGGSDAGCERRALTFGRRHVRAEVTS